MVGELRTLTSHAGLLPHHSSGEEDSDRSTARPRFIRKIVGTHGRRYLNSGILTETVGDEDGVGGGLEKGGHGMAWEGWVGGVSAMIHEIRPQYRLIGKGCNRTASKPVSHPFHDHADRDHDLIFHHFPHDSMP